MCVVVCLRAQLSVNVLQIFAQVLRVFMRLLAFGFILVFFSLRLNRVELTSVDVTSASSVTQTPTQPLVARPAVVARNNIVTRWCN